MSDRTLKFTVTYGKEKLDLALPGTSTVTELKQVLEEKTRVPQPMQKIFFKGQIKNESLTLQDLQIRPNSKLMLIGSTAAEITQASSTAPVLIEEEKKQEPQEIFTREERKIIEKGLPPDVMPVSTGFSSLPSSIHGIFDHSGTPARLTIRNDIEQLWVATNVILI
jgi:hypothetical protein